MRIKQQSLWQTVHAAGKKWVREDRLFSICFHAFGKAAEITAPAGSRTSAAPTSATIQKPANGESAKTTIANTAILMMSLMISTRRKPHLSERRPPASSNVRCRKPGTGRLRVLTNARRPESIQTRLTQPLQAPPHSVRFVLYMLHKQVISRPRQWNFISCL